MRGGPLQRGLLSFVVPGLGQMVSGRAERGACILGLVLVVGNLNAIFLSVYASTLGGELPFFARGLPRLLHDVFAVYVAGPGRGARTCAIRRLTTAWPFGGATG